VKRITDEEAKKTFEVIKEARRLQAELNVKKDEESRKAFWDFVHLHGLGDSGVGMLDDAR
jgi:hypothetical protein